MYLETTKKQQAQADKAYDIQTNIMQQQVMAEQVQDPAGGEGSSEIKVQEAEIKRRENELIATTLKQAEVERRRIETLASAEKMRLTTEAEGHAAAIRSQGEAEAEIIFKKGEAEAKAMNVKAEAFQEYNQAAVIDKLLTGLPEVVRALAAPLANIDKITIVSTGNGDSAGMHKITGDITKMAAQIPALFETLVGHADVRITWKSEKHRRQISQAGQRRGNGRKFQGGNGYGTHGASGNTGPSESERSDRQGRGAGEDDQASDSRYAESTAAGQDAGGDRDRRSAPAREEAEGEPGERPPSGFARRSWRWTKSRTTWRGRRSSAR